MVGVSTRCDCEDFTQTAQLRGGVQACGCVSPCFHRLATT